MCRIAIMAGEKSGDRLGAGLIRAAAGLHPQLSFSGVAGTAMIDAGCRPWFHSDELAVMGLIEPVRHLPRLWRMTRALEARMLADPPDVLVGIDSPDFNLRIERKLRRAGVPTVHYVSPSVWAWRRRRVKLLREACDRVLCLLPFEAEFLQAHGVAAEFVGHPLADDIPEEVDQQAARRALDLGDGTVVAILPGSRSGEVQRLGPVFAATAAWLTRRIPGLECVAPMASPQLASQFRQVLRQHGPDCRVRVVDGRAHQAMAAADAVLLTSGTATLEAMLLNRPMVVAYRASAGTYALAWLLRLTRLEHFSLPNLLAGASLVPEFLQGEVRPEALGRAMMEQLEQGAGAGHALHGRFQQLHRRLRRGADAQAARAVLRVGRIGRQ